MLWGVVGLPVLLPIVALLQLLFPGILRDQWRQYRYAVQTLLTQSTLICLHWALVKWVFIERPRWLSDDALAAALVAVAVVGVARAWFNRAAALGPTDKTGPADATDPGAAGSQPAPSLTTQPSAPISATLPAVANAPTSLEFWALGLTLLVGLAWAAYALATGGSPWDQMAVITVAALAGSLHLVYRKWRARLGSFVPRISTELVFVLGLAIAGTGIGLYARQANDNQLAGEVRGEWTTFHGNSRRTGTAMADDPGPRQPQILWTFDPQERKGRISIHSSPCVVGGQVYVGAMHQVLGLAQGFLYCINAADGQQSSEHGLALGERIWKFSADNSLKPVFASPTVAGGCVYIGEGYHQNDECRLFCLDAQDAARVLWIKPTASHVESTPTVAGNHIYFGAGDDGVLCLDTAQLQTGLDGRPVPKTLWHFTGAHVDASPALVGNRLFVGSVAGDRYQKFCALAIDADTGRELWRAPAPIPVPSAPAAVDEHVFFALGNGKLTEDADEPDGRIWCLAPADGRREWEFRAASSILGSPVVAGDRVYCASRDRFCYALDAGSGALIWKRELDGPIVTTPIVTSSVAQRPAGAGQEAAMQQARGGRVFVLTSGGTLFALDELSGEIVWRFDEIRAAAGDTFSSPVLAEGRIYAAIGGKLYCIGDSK
jgi:outer membrane protein assembly factor BamB